MPSPTNLKERKLWIKRLSKAKIKYNIILTKEFLINEYIKNKKTIKQIAKEVNCSISPIRRTLKIHDIKMRTISEIQKGLHSGKKNGSYIDDRTNKIYYCLDCNKEISYETGFYGKGRCQKCYHRYAKLTGMRAGINSGMLSKNRTKEEKLKFRKLMKNIMGKEEIRRKLSLSRGGTGIPYENRDYPEIFYKIRTKIRKRDNNTCQLCGKLENGRQLDVHHIDYDKDNCKEDNLISLCSRCHGRTICKNREKWIKYFQEALIC